MPIYMKPGDWVRAYEEGVPHWAEDRTPSPLAEQFLKMFDNGSGNKILEIGVGNGRDSIYFATKGNNVTGIDIVGSAIDLAIKNAELTGLADKLDLRVGNAEKLEFGDSSFDGVYSVSVLHATDLDLSLKEIARVLKNGGKAMIYLYEKTESKGKEYWFTERKKVEELLRNNDLVVEDKWDIPHTGHEREKTTVLIYRLTKDTGAFERENG